MTIVELLKTVRMWMGNQPTHTILLDEESVTLCEIEDHRGEAIVKSKSLIVIPAELQGKNFNFLFTKVDDVVTFHRDLRHLEYPGPEAKSKPKNDENVPHPRPDHNPIPDDSL